MSLGLVASESAFDYFASTRAYLERHGKPVALQDRLVKELRL